MLDKFILVSEKPLPPESVAVVLRKIQFLIYFLYEAVILYLSELYLTHYFFLY